MRSQVHYKGQKSALDREKPQEESRKPQTKQTLEKKKYKVFISGLSNEMNKVGLISYFKSIYASTINFIVKKRGSSTNEKISGFGFLIMGSFADAQDTLERKLFYYKRRYLRAEPYLRDRSLEKHKEDFENKRIFIGRVPKKMNSMGLWRVLEEEVGPVDNAYVVTNTKKEKNKHKGFGYAIFASPDIAKRALILEEIFVEEFGISLKLEKPKRKKKREGYQKNKKIKVQKKINKIEKPKINSASNRIKQSKNSFKEMKRIEAKYQEEFNAINDRQERGDRPLQMESMDLQDNFNLSTYALNQDRLGRNEITFQQNYERNFRREISSGKEGSQNYPRKRTIRSLNSSNQSPGNSNSHYKHRTNQIWVLGGPHGPQIRYSHPKDIMSTNGWKNHSLHLINHSGLNIRFNHAKKQN